MKTVISRSVLLGLLILTLAGAAVSRTPAQAPPAAAPADTSGPSAHFDPQAATEAWLARMTPEQRTHSDAYFEGGYWLLLWEFLYGLGAAWLLLGSRLSVRMRDLAERVAPFRWLQTFLYAVQYILVTFVLSYPLSLYADFFREHQYGLSSQSFGGWMTDELKGLAIALIFGSLALVLLYWVLRKAPRTWWLWGAVMALLLLVLAIAVAPVFIEPIFNKYTELQDPALRGPILSLARANGIPTDHVYVFDASKQTNRMSANVAGLFGTTRIALNDNLLRRAAPPEIEAVMGHEMGHYVLHHVSKSILFFGVVLAIGFGFLRWGFERTTAGRGEGQRWGIRGVDDPAGLPLLAALFSIYLFVLTPVINTHIRTEEAEADIFGLNAARQPDGMAQAALHLAEYRKMSPGPLEEWIFFDHPSGRNRILMSMRWKAEHLGEVKP